jgi:hypothetical protein
MPRKGKINFGRLKELMRSNEIQAVLTDKAEKLVNEANADFWNTAPGQERYRQRATGRDPYDTSLVVGDDRARVYVQTTSYAARRHEQKSSSLLRVSP